jgi:hypothetical protein
MRADTSAGEPSDRDAEAGPCLVRLFAASRRVSDRGWTTPRSPALGWLLDSDDVDKEQQTGPEDDQA